MTTLNAKLKTYSLLRLQGTILHLTDTVGEARGEGMRKWWQESDMASNLLSPWAVDLGELMILGTECSRDNIPMVFFSCHWHPSKFNVRALASAVLIWDGNHVKFSCGESTRRVKMLDLMLASGHFLILLIGSCSYWQNCSEFVNLWICEYWSIQGWGWIVGRRGMVRFYDLDRRIVLLIIFNILGVPSLSSSWLCCEGPCLSSRYSWNWRSPIRASPLLVQKLYNRLISPLYL